MSLANEILYGTEQKVAAMLKSGADPNEFDEYGFPPIVEAAIANRESMAKVLLEQGADPNQGDLFGRTALHWAIENHNQKLGELLLAHRANPNAPTTAGESPLVVALLRNQEDMKSMLYRAGANLGFAKDYINAKLIGHRYELVGHAYICDPQNKFVLVDYEGFVLEFSLNIIHDSLARYKNNFAAKNLRQIFGYVSRILEALANACALMRYQQYLVDLHAHNEQIDQLLANQLVLIPSTFQGHAITFVKYGQLLAKIDRGANSKFEGSVVIYRITKPKAASSGFFKQIIYKKQTDHFIHKGINETLGLKKLMELPVGPQITGNCSWANVEASIPTMLFLLLMGDSQGRIDLQQCVDEALDFYAQWREWDKDRALDECLAAFSENNEYRNTSRACILAAVLFQASDYTQIENVARAERILPILENPNYEEALKSYLSTYYSDQWTVSGENLHHLLDIVHPKQSKPRK